MTADLPPKLHIDPERKTETLDDNARKFTTDVIEADFLLVNDAIGFRLITDWLEIGVDTEVKLARKVYDNGQEQLLLISKITNDTARTSTKEAITTDQYQMHIASSVCHLEKMRYEFTYRQNDTLFDVKYDEFIGSSLRIVEVDAQSDAERESFTPDAFTGALQEVTGDIRFYGYRVADLV